MPILYELHWLPVRERIEYKVALICFKCLRDEAPIYLKEFLTVYSPSRTLRSSSDKSKLVLKNSPNYVFYGGRSFPAIAPKVWNDLPKAIRESSNVNIFKSKLKHHIFRQTYFDG